ncbi:hypothetical protein PV08_03159 [Exophiala spinifera]|uniref:RTA1 domain protein n=1 Tax=Exophiala spinifera TaxID=91928 RepID=A0A0D2BJV7_9EURO|nr:uncharacterized protein PV08_03159 [Exophiala spinifera]KIW18870.1 hypothetical protein PV08_03159 [Exophiala spinifera]
MPDKNPYHSYVPSVPAAIIAALVFIVLSIGHTYLLIRSRKWFASAIIIGGLFEVIGFAARAYNHSHLDESGPFIIQTLLILLAPILFAASVYMFLGRLINAAGGQKYSIIRTTWLTKIFVVGDVLCFLIQAGGAGILVNADTKEENDKASNIILAGLALQVLFFALFVLAAVLFHVRARSRALWQHAASSGLYLGRVLASLYAVGVLITLRNIYRFAEFKEGQDGYLLEHEWPVYAFDAALMAIVMAITLYWYGVPLNPKGGEEGYQLNDEDSYNNQYQTPYQNTYPNAN